MSIEVLGKDPLDQNIVDAVSNGVAKILDARGVYLETQQTTGILAAQYAVELLLSATHGFLETEPGIWSDKMMTDAVAVISDCSANPDHVSYYEAYEKKAAQRG